MNDPALIPLAPAVPAAGGAPVRAAAKERLAAVAFYFGLAPLLWPFRVQRNSPFVQHHAAQALATILLFLAVLLGSGLYWVGLSYLLVYRRELYGRLPTLAGWGAPARDALPLTAAFLGWLLIWLAGLLLALCGSWRTLPLVGRLAGRPALLRLALVGNASLLVVTALIAALAVHASFLTRDDDAPAAAYLLYDDMGFVPRWVMNLGFYRIALAARARWGPGSVVAAPLDEHHLRLALRNGRFVFLACHGRGGDIETPRLWITPCPPAEAGATAARGLYVTDLDDNYRPRRWAYLPTGHGLRFVYNTACDGGSRAGEWQTALAPAEVWTFDRLSAVLEHLLWLWTDGPRRVEQIE